MKKLLSYTLFIIGLFTCVIISVKADSCTYKEQQALSKEAKNIKVSYEIKEQKLPEGYSYYANGILDANGNDVTDNFSDYYVGYYLKINLVNLQDNMYVVLDGASVTNKNKEEVSEVRFENTDNGSAELYIYDVDNVHNIVFSIYSNTENCPDKNVGITRLVTPRYNELHELSMCQGISEYKYCQQFIESSAKKEIMMNEIAKYKKSLNDKKVAKKDNGIIKVIIIIVLSLAGITLLVMIIRIAIIKMMKKKGKTW